MGKEHDDLQIKISNKEKIINLIGKEQIKKIWGERGTWGNKVCHDIINNDFKNTSILLLHDFLTEFKHNENITLGIIHDSLTLQKDQLQHLDQYESFLTTIENERPITKGQNQYKVTKGFVDVFVTMTPNKTKHFSSYQDRKYTHIFIIEVKTKKDLEDLGAILRQIKEYREYLNYNSLRLDFEIASDQHIDYCVYVEEITEVQKKYFEDNHITVLYESIKK
jgi:hypothetical protein